MLCLGLIQVIVGGAELFTGNARMAMAAVDRKIAAGALQRDLGLVHAGNLIGLVGPALAFGLTGPLNGPMAGTARGIAEAKVALAYGFAYLGPA